MWVLVANVGGLYYFVQKVGSLYCLNGLVENGHKFESKEGAWLNQQLFETKTGVSLQPMPVSDFIKSKKP